LKAVRGCAWRRPSVAGPRRIPGRADDRFVGVLPRCSRRCPLRPRVSGPSERFVAEVAPTAASMPARPGCPSPSPMWAPDHSGSVRPKPVSTDHPRGDVGATAPVREVSWPIVCLVYGPIMFETYSRGGGPVTSNIAASTRLSLYTSQPQLDRAVLLTASISNRSRGPTVPLVETSPSVGPSASGRWRPFSYLVPPESRPSQ